MREIKFRFFDGVEMNHNIMGYDFNCGGPNKDLLMVWNDKKECIEYYDTSEGLDLMQYIGIKDKKGKEVYEGDIFECSEGNLYEVSFCESYLRFEATELYMRESFELNDFICAGSNYDDILDGRIMGNIYENKALLEGGE